MRVVGLFSALYALLQRPVVSFTTTVLGLLALLIVPLISWRITEQARQRVEHKIEPGREQILDAFLSAYRLRNIAFTYDTPPVGPLQLPFGKDERSEYERELSLWRRATADDSNMRIGENSILWNWQTGKARLQNWIDGYGRDALYKGVPPNPTENATFQSGIRLLETAYKQMSDQQEIIRNEIDRINQVEIWAEVALAVLTLLLAAIAWENAHNLYNSWKRESEAAARLEVAIKESNHRIKNNLQVVGSLLEMQTYVPGDQVDKEALRDISLQVRAMAAVHDFLSRELHSEVIRSDRMLEKLVTLTAGPAGIEVQLQADPALLSVKQATATALIANELLLNAGKHGATRAVVRLVAEDGSARLTVQDDGPGFPTGFDPARDASLGIALVDTLTRTDLKGDVRFANDSGASILITFPLSTAS